MKVCLFVSVSQALKEIARVSEELCSYQDEIRRKSDGKRLVGSPIFHFSFWFKYLQ